MNLIEMLKPKTPKTIGAALRQALVRTAVIMAALASGFLVAQAAVGNQAVLDDQTPSRQETAFGKAAVLAESKGCWTGEAPADMVGQVPGHVVVIKDGLVRYGADRLVGQALAQAFDGEDHGLQVVAFCR